MEEIKNELGTLIFIEDWKGNKQNHYARVGKFICFCGKEFITESRNILQGRTKSCGCYKGPPREHGVRYVDGRTKTRLYQLYVNMKNRTGNPNNKNYAKYGAKGITVCEEWKNDFVAFRDWALANGYRDDLTLDRKRGELGYSPDNCRWATPQEQSRNTKKSNNRSSKYKGVSYKKGRTDKPLPRPWQAEVTINYKRIRLGMFETEVEAAQAYIDFVKEHFGEFAKYVPIESVIDP